MQKIDLKKELRHLYHASAKEPVEVDVPAFRFLMIDGRGDPNTSPAYAEAVEALFSVSYRAKFIVKNDLKPLTSSRPRSPRRAAKKQLPALDLLRFEEFTEGRCAQIMHVGPFSAEGPTIARLHAFIAERGRLTGKHHEIYLSDIRRADPGKWKTIIRQPFR